MWCPLRGEIHQFILLLHFLSASIFCSVKVLLLLFLPQVSMELNPGAPSQPSAGELLHLRAVGDNDTLHFLFCSQGAPSLLLVHTNTSSSVLQVGSTSTSTSLRCHQSTSPL